MVIAVWLHMYRVFLTGSYKPPREFNWVVGCTHRGMPSTTAPVRNLIGCNMSFRREVFSRIGGFRDQIGRVGARPSGCDETELYSPMAIDPAPETSAAAPVATRTVRSA